MNKILFLLLVAFAFTGCNSDDDNATDQDVNVTFVFSHNWDGANFTNANFGNTNYTNENGDVLQIERLRYLISNIRLHRQNGEIVRLQGYQLVDLSNEGSLSISLNKYKFLPKGEYTGISFIFGFDEQDNDSGLHSDLNSISWNWPDMLGGGYHFLQMDGNYQTTEGPQPFNFHMGKARVSEGVFEANYRHVLLTATYTIAENNTIRFNMNVAEWFRNPNTWDLNELNTVLMPNYEAQKMMNENAATVFSIGEITNP